VFWEIFLLDVEVLVPDPGTLVRRSAPSIAGKPLACRLAAPWDDCTGSVEQLCLQTADAQIVSRPCVRHGLDDDRGCRATLLQTAARRMGKPLFHRYDLWYALLEQ
jgi:hypothetical protein